MKPLMGKKILLAEGDNSIKRLIADSLNESGAEVEYALTPKEIATKTKLHAFDFAIIEKNLSGADAYNITKVLKANDESSDIDVIVLISNPNPGEIIEGKESGVTTFLVKPFNKTQLISTIEKVIARQ